MTETLPSGALRWRDIAELTSSSGYPCVSVLLATTPAARLLPADALALTGLIERAEQALQAIGGTRAAPLHDRLRLLAREVARRPVGRALGLFVSRDVQRSIILPVSVASRVLVEPSFATRELLRALHRTPPHLLLTLYPGHAGFFHAQGANLSPAAQVLLSVDATAYQSDHGGSATAIASDAMLDEVDEVLGRQRVLFPSPLVVCGTSGLVTAFCRRSRHLSRLAGRITDPDTTEALQQQAGRVLEDYLRSRGREALDLVELTAYERPDQLAIGLNECWARVHESAPLVLAVEEGYAAPGHLFGDLESPDGGDPLWQHDLTDDPFFVHDLVDDLIEAVIRRAGWVAFVDDGALADYGRVALVTMD